MADTMTMPAAGELVRAILGQDGGDGDWDGEWEGLTALEFVDPTRIDAVDHPASGIGFLLLKGTGRKGGPRTPARVLKADGERRFTLCVVYPASRPDVSVAMDGARDFAPESVLEAGAWSFLRKGGQVGLHHKDGTAGAGTVVESHIHRAPPWPVTAADGSQQTVMPGDWLAGIVWDEPAWRLIKSGAVTGVSMQGGASRRKPTKEELRLLRKGKAVPLTEKTLQKAVRAAMRDPAVKDVMAGVRTAAKGTGKRITKLEKRDGLRCARCGKRAGAPGASFCGKCGKPLGRKMAKAAAAAGTPADARMLGRVIKGSRSADPVVRDRALGRLIGAFGPETAGRLMTNEAALREVGGSVAAAAALLKAADGQDDDGAECRTCGGKGRLRHPVSGANGRTCPSCDGSGRQGPDDGGAGISKDAAGRLAEAVGRATSRGPDAATGIGQLISMVGPGLAAKVVSGESVSAEEFRRGYVSARRAPLSARPGQHPRVPVATHVISPDDFRRGPLGAGQSRPAPGSQWPGSGSQRDFYQPGPGTGSMDSLFGLDGYLNGTGPTTAVPARAAL